MLTQDRSSKNTPTNHPVLTVRAPVTNDKGRLSNQGIVEGHGQLTTRQGGMYIVYNTFHCNSHIVYNLYVPAGKPSTGAGTGLSIQYPQKNPYPLHGYGFLLGTGAGMTSGTRGFTRAVPYSPVTSLYMYE
jgi:hypothetical protein